MLNRLSILLFVLTLLPNCGDPATDPGPVTLHVLFEERPTNEILQLYWDGNLVRTWGTGHRASFSWPISRIVPQQATTVTVTAVSGGGTTVSQVNPYCSSAWMKIAVRPLVGNVANLSVTPRPITPPPITGFTTSSRMAAPTVA